MSANLAPPAKLQFFDNNGNPLVAGKLYTYAAGTSTPLATYTDASAGTPNTNPVILDSRGEANVWLGTDPYKFVLKTSADVTIWTVDNVASFISAARILGANGTAAEPTYSFTNDTDCGWYRVGAGQLGLSIDGKPVLRTTDAAGTFGQNWTTDTFDLTQYGTFNGVYVGAGKLSGLDCTAVGYEALWTNSTGANNTAMGNGALTLATSDNNTAVGFGAGVQVSNGEGNVLVGSDAGLTLETGDYNVLIGFGADVGANSSSRQIVLGYSTTGFANDYATLGQGTNRLYIHLDGATTAWTAASDARLKTDVQDYSVGLSFVNDLRPVTFKWKAKRDVPDELKLYTGDSDEPCMGRSGATYEGFLAQDIKALVDKHGLPSGQAVWRQGDDGVQSVAPGALVPILVKAIQELSAQVAELQRKLA
ncbi:MAG: tail fiber domain-containing protein [Candidatus Limnocylindrus sp.]